MSSFGLAGAAKPGAWRWDYRSSNASFVHLDPTTPVGTLWRCSTVLGKTTSHYPRVDRRCLLPSTRRCSLPKIIFIVVPIGVWNNVHSRGGCTPTPTQHKSYPRLVMTGAKSRHASSAPPPSGRIPTILRDFLFTFPNYRCHSGRNAEMSLLVLPCLQNPCSSPAKSKVSTNAPPWHVARGGGAVRGGGMRRILPPNVTHNLPTSR